MKDPERFDLPSGSSFEIVVSCPGQPALKAKLPDRPQGEPDEIALSGIRIHKARETGNTSELDADELDIYKAGLEYEKRLLQQWIADHQILEYYEGPSEERIWLHDPESGDRLLSARLDVHFIGKTVDGKTKLLVVDWKTGWSWHLTPSQRNWQLRVQGVLVYREHNDVELVRVGFVKPIATAERLDFTDYNRDALVRSEELLYRHLWEAKQPGAPRHAGGHCNFCPCKADCPEGAAYALLPQVMAMNAVFDARRNGQPSRLPPAPDWIERYVETLSLPDLAFIHLRAQITAKIFDAVKERLKTLSTEKLQLIGLTRKDGRKLDPITKTKDAFEFLKLFGISEEEIWTALKFSKGELVDALRRDQGWGKDAASGFVNGRMGVFIEKKRAEDSIVSNSL